MNFDQYLEMIHIKKVEFDTGRPLDKIALINLHIDYLAITTSNEGYYYYY